jgi:hypothetical protein
MKGTRNVTPPSTNLRYLPSRSTKPFSVGLTIRSDEINAYTTTINGTIIAKTKSISTKLTLPSLFSMHMEVRFKICYDNNILSATVYVLKAK